MSAGPDLTGAIEAAHSKVSAFISRPTAEVMIVAALPHIREALAQQVERASGPYTSVITDEVLERAARIVRGLS